MLEATSKRVINVMGQMAVGDADELQCDADANA